MLWKALVDKDVRLRVREDRKSLSKLGFAFRDTNGMMQ